MFFKVGEIVQIGDVAKRWCIDVLAETYRGGELVQVADLSDVDGVKRTVVTDQLTKVGG